MDKEYVGAFVFSVPVRSGEASVGIGSRRYRIGVARVGGRTVLNVDRRGGGLRDQIRLAPQAMRTRAGKPFVSEFAETTLLFPGSGPLPIGLRRVPDAAPTVPEWAGRLVVAPTYAYLGRASFGGKAILVGVTSVGSGEDFLALDLDRNGRAGNRLDERLRLDEPFRLSGRTFQARLAFVDGRPVLQVALSTEPVAGTPLRPAFAVPSGGR